jgi:hypothetical protein
MSKQGIGVIVGVLFSVALQFTEGVPAWFGYAAWGATVLGALWWLYKHFSEQRRWHGRFLYVPKAKARLNFMRGGEGISGLVINAVSADRDALQVRVMLTDIRRWDPALRRYVATHDVYGAFPNWEPVRLGYGVLYPNVPMPVGILWRTNDALEITGTIDADDPRDRDRKYRLRQHGIWRFSYTIMAPDKRDASKSVCVSWTGELPEQCECPR